MPFGAIVRLFHVTDHICLCQANLECGKIVCKKERSFIWLFSEPAAEQICRKHAYEGKGERTTRTTRAQIKSKYYGVWVLFPFYIMDFNYVDGHINEKEKKTLESTKK